MKEAFEFHAQVAERTSADPRVIAGIEEAIVRLSKTKKRKITFFYPIVDKKYTKPELEEMHDHVLNLTKKEALLDDPALTQKLITILKLQRGNYDRFISEISQFGMAYQACLLLEMQFKIS